MATFPYMPMMAIMASMISSVVVQMSVFAYAGFMVENLGVVDDKNKAGYYAGALSAAFMIGRVCSSHFWGMVADRCGRRFILMFSTLSTMLLSVVFGCSTTFTMAFVSRYFIGLLSGATVVCRTLVSETCTTKEHETIGMGVMTTSWTVGTVLGPGIGGLLAEPAKHYSHQFSEQGLFGKYPYLLPNLVGSALALLAVPLVALYVKDNPSAESSIKNKTEPGSGMWACCDFGEWGRHGDEDGRSDRLDTDHKSETKAEPDLMETYSSADRVPSWMMIEKMDPRAVEDAGSHDKDAGRATHTTPDTKQESLLAQGRIRVIIFMNGLFALVYSGFDEVYPLWALSSVSQGGLDWSSPQIGKVFVACGILVLGFETLAVPTLTPWMGVQMSQRASSIFEVPIYFICPLLSRVHGNDLLGLTLSVILLFACYVCSNAFLLAISLTVNNAPGNSRRAELNGLSLTIESVARAISPMACSALFAFSIDGDHAYPFEYHLIFYVIGLVRLAAGWIGWDRITDNGNME